ncbi:hypothetical protein ACFQ08_18075 [Streptosporangium algeriense]|uniref:SAM-dependent methyltransferase n=1 Tax=Streptosporangium algeriense TaxID=1682748 RepID=A0ABW3DRH2_9ACTN
MNKYDIPEQWHGQASTPIAPADAYNGYIAANVIFALDRLGLMERIGRGDRLYTEDYADNGRALALLRAATCCGYLKADDDVYIPTEAGQEIALSRGYFTWAVGGYNEVFANAGQLTGGLRHYDPSDIHREESMVALGSAQCDQAMFAALLDEVLDDVEFGTIADLGSGNSARVSRVVAQRPGTRGMGIDISEPATLMARRDIAAAGLQDRVQAVQADVLDVLDRQRQLEITGEVDTVMSFFLLHDLLADPKTRADIMPRMREAFPNARRFVLGDTMLRDRIDHESMQPIFSVGFELAHAMMGIPLHTRSTYDRLFTDAGLRIARVEPFATPHSWLYVLDVV